MDKLTLEYIKNRASESENASIKAVSCEDIRVLLAERESLLQVIDAILENAKSGDFTLTCNDTSMPVNFNHAENLIKSIKES